MKRIKFLNGKCQSENVRCPGVGLCNDGNIQSQREPGAGASVGG